MKRVSELRHVILCPHCKKCFWASASRGKSGRKFPAYHCSGVVKKKSTHDRYAISADEFNKTVEEYIQSIRFTTEDRDAFELIIKDTYRKKHKKQISESKSIAQQVNEKRTELETLYEKLKRVVNPTVERKIEEEMEQLDFEIKELEQKRNQSEATEHDMAAYLKNALYLLEHPAEILLKPREKKEQQAIWSLVFEELPTYEEIKTGTPKLALCFNAKGTLADASGGVVDLSLPTLNYSMKVQKCVDHYIM